MTITAQSIGEFTVIIAGLVREGLAMLEKSRQQYVQVMRGVSQ